MTQIRIEAVTGSTPISVYIADIYGNNQSLLGIITNTGVIPPAKRYIPPSIFDTAPAVMVKLIDNRGCEKFKILDCSFGCGFDIEVRLASCVVTMSVTQDDCLYEINISETVDPCLFSIEVDQT